MFQRPLAKIQIIIVLIAGVAYVYVHVERPRSHADNTAIPLPHLAGTASQSHVTRGFVGSPPSWPVDNRPPGFAYYFPDRL